MDATGQSAAFMQVFHSTPRFKGTNAHNSCIESIPSFHDATKTEEAMHSNAICRVPSNLAAEDLLGRRQRCIQRGALVDAKVRSHPVLLCPPFVVLVRIPFPTPVDGKGKGTSHGTANEAAMEDLVLDRGICYWVLIPLSLSMFLIGVLRSRVQRMFAGEGTKTDVEKLKRMQVTARAKALRTNAHWLEPQAFAARKAYFVDRESGALYEKLPEGSTQMQLLSDPDAVNSMMKKNLGMMVPQMLTFAWVNFFFSGFIAAKIPFPLTPRFRVMLQRGIDLQNLDVRYVSSLSWYFINMFGLGALFNIFLGDVAVDDTQMMQQQMSMQSQQVDLAKTYKGERDGLELLEHKWILPLMQTLACSVLKDQIRAVEVEGARS